MSNVAYMPGKNLESYVRFVDQFNNPIDAEDSPKVTIADVNGKIWQSATSNGVSLYEEPGIYKLTYVIPTNFPDGYGQITWTTQIGADTITSAFPFLVSSTADFQDTTKPDYEPGADINFGFTKEEVDGMNILMKILKIRLKNDGTRKVPDGAGGFVDSTCSIFSDDELTCFLVFHLLCIQNQWSGYLRI